MAALLQYFTRDVIHTVAELIQIVETFSSFYPQVLTVILTAAMEGLERSPAGG